MGKIVTRESLRKMQFAGRLELGPVLGGSLAIIVGQRPKTGVSLYG